MSALDALVGDLPADEAVEAALATIPAGELADVFRGLARQHGSAAVPILRRSLVGRPDQAAAAAAALGTLAVPAAVDALLAAEATAPPKAVKTAVRRALYRLRQAGLTPVAKDPVHAPPSRHRLAEGWMSAVDGTGSRGVWLAIEGPLGERTLLRGVVSDGTGLLDFAAEGIAKRRLGAWLAAVRAESPLPWVAVPAPWAWMTLVAASRLGTSAPPRDLLRWLDILGEPPAMEPPIRAVRLTPSSEPALLAGSAELLALPELAGWFLDPPAVHAEALELLQTKESRLVVSDQIKAERAAALVDRVIDEQFDAGARRLWARRLEETAFVLFASGRPAEAERADAVAAALAADGPAPRRLPFVRALVERSLEVAGEVTLGRLAASEASRAPRPRGSGPLSPAPR